MKRMFGSIVDSKYSTKPCRKEDPVLESGRSNIRTAVIYASLQDNKIYITTESDQPPSNHPIQIQENPVEATTDSIPATTLIPLPPSVLSKIFTPPPFVPPTTNHLSSTPPNVIPRTCFKPVLTSATASKLSTSKIPMESPAGEGSFRLEIYTYGVGKDGLGGRMDISAASIP